MNVGVSGLNCFKESVVNEYVLLFGLDEKIALIADVAQEAAYVQFVLAFNLFEHSVQHNVGP
jgi:hypothetical protein